MSIRLQAGGPVSAGDPLGADRPGDGGSLGEAGAGRRDAGQIIVVFALALTAIVAMVGLVLDGGSAYAQRRSEQNAADLAALASANDLIVNLGNADWQGTALRVAKENGYEDGVHDVKIDLTCHNCPGMALDPAFDGVQVVVSITDKHANAFAGVVGMPTWDVSVTATALTGWPDTGVGPGPFIVSKKAFGDGGQPIVCTEDAPCDLNHPTTTEGDSPREATQFAWTGFGYDKNCDAPGNVDANDLKSYMNESASFSISVQFGCYIAQHNSGQMDTIVQALADLAPITFPVPIVDDEGCFQGWAMFTLTGAHPNGSNGWLTGYFKSGLVYKQLKVKSPGFGQATFGGNYNVTLVN